MKPDVALKALPTLEEVFPQNHFYRPPDADTLNSGYE